MKIHFWRRILMAVVFALPLTGWIVRASNPLGSIQLPPQGCTSGTSFTTCVFYVLINEDDAGIRLPGCGYTISAPEIYVGACDTGAAIVSGFRFQNVSLPSNQSILASYIEFTVDGPYGANAITANIYGQASTSPNSFTGTSPSDITNRPTVQPTTTWNIKSTNTIYNMGDPWLLGETRRTSDLTPILSAVISQPGWQNNNPAAFLFKNMTPTPADSHRRVLAKERNDVIGPARLVVRVGQIPSPSVSYYWQSVINCSPTSGCTVNNTKLRDKAIIEARRNHRVLVILDFGNPKVNSIQIGTTIINQPTKWVSISKIEDAIKQYITVFMSYELPPSKLWLGVGTNNAGDLMCANQGNGTNHGREWALMINRLNTWVNQRGYNTFPYPADKIRISGASDIETWTGRPDSPNILTR